MRKLTFLAWLIAAPLGAQESNDRADLSREVAGILSRAEFRGSSFGILVCEVDSGKIVYGHRADALLPPASTAKLVSCAGALAELGKDFRFETPVVRTGPVVRGTLRGDLVLVASGDPNLSQRVVENRLRYVDRDHTYAGFTDAEVVPGDPLQVVRSLAQKVAAAGVREVSGDVIVDDGLFKETTDSFVGALSAICVNDNVIDVSISPGRAKGTPAKVEYRPATDIVKVRVEAKTIGVSGRSDVWIERDDGVASFVVRGNIAAGSPPILRVGRLARPALAASHYLRAALADVGVRVRGRARQARFGPTVYRKFDVVARHVSPPFSESVKVTLKVSHNLHATMYPLLVGALKGKSADRAAGFARIRQTLERSGLDVERVAVGSGSGGGRSDALSARFSVDLLRAMAKRRDFDVFFDALPIGGKDGTIASRFRRSPLRGLVHAKTGTLVYKSSFNGRWIYLSKALSGYIDLRTDKRPRDLLAFSILVANTVAENRDDGAEALFRAQEEILDAVAFAWRRENPAGAAGFDPRAGAGGGN